MALRLHIAPGMDGGNGECWASTVQVGGNGCALGECRWEAARPGSPNCGATIAQERLPLGSQDCKDLWASLGTPSYHGSVGGKTIRKENATKNRGHSSEAVSPPSREPIAHQTTGSIASLRYATWPSAATTCTPPPCMLLAVTILFPLPSPP